MHSKQSGRSTVLKAHLSRQPRRRRASPAASQAASNERIKSHFSQVIFLGSKLDFIGPPIPKTKGYSAAIDCDVYLVWEKAMTKLHQS